MLARLWRWLFPMRTEPEPVDRSPAMPERPEILIPAAIPVEEATTRREKERAGRPYREMTAKGLAMLMAHEGVHFAMYRDPIGLPTIGVGHLLTRDELHSGKIAIKGHTVHWRNGLTKEQTLDLLDQDLDEIEIKLHREPGGIHELTNEQLDAVISLIFNIGWYAWKNPGDPDKSTIRRLILGRDLKAAAREFPKWRRAGGEVLRGLVLRRERERELFERGTYWPERVAA